MKKIIYSLLVLAMAAFTFSSCEDVPAPYDMPTKPETPELSTDGTEANPYTVADAKIAATGTNVFVKAFIVGYVPDKALNEAIFSDAASAEKAPTNILIAASADETNVTNCMPIQLPAGAIRTALNLKDNPGNLKQEVILCGNIENYFGATGLKSVAYAKIGAKEFGTKPGDSTTTPDTPSTGKGSASDPYTVAEAVAAIKAGAPTNEVYLTGIISEVGYYNETYKSLSYYISDDGKSKDMQVYSGKGLNGADFTSKGDLKVGQKVTIKGIIKSFTDKNGTEIMEVDKSSTIIKIEGEGTGGEVTPKPEIPDTGDGMTVNSIISGKTSATDLTENSYGTQAVDKNETWYSWKYENVAYSGVKICKANGDFTGCIQVQGNASDASKQGFFFNSSAFSKDIKSITLYLSTKEGFYAPTYSIYADNSANGKTNKVAQTSTSKTTADGFTTYTETYDFSSYNAKFFTLWNNTQGVLYIKKIVVTLK